MEVAKFIKLFNARYADHRRFIDLKTISWEHFKLIKAGSEGINYYCDFENGMCFRKRRQGLNKDIKNKMCCCIDCFASIGHFRYLQQDNRVEMEMLAKNFIEPKDSTKLVDSGFWRVKEGCVLPRMHRSIICLRHFCNSAVMSEIDLFYLDRILSAFNYEEVQDKLIKFMTKENNGQGLLIDEASPLQRKLAIDTLWKFVKQEFDKYKERTKLRKLRKAKRKERHYAARRT